MSLAFNGQVRRVGMFERGRTMVGIALLALASSGCGAPTEQEPAEELGTSAQEIKNGRIVDRWQIFPISSVVLYTKNGAASCSGTIISERHVLSARHCATMPGDYVFYFDGGSLTQLHTRVKAVYHTPLTGEFDYSYDRWGKFDDWEVLYLEERIPPGYRPAKLADTRLPPNSTVFEVGAGRHDDVITAGIQLRFRQTSIQDCNRGWCSASGWGLATENISNKGDSGGPLYTNDPGNQVYGGSGLKVHSSAYGWLENQGQHTSVAAHFNAIMEATGMVTGTGVVDTLVSGEVVPVINQRDCTAQCRIVDVCTAYNYTPSTNTCTLRYGKVSGVTSNAFSYYGIKGETGTSPFTSAFPAGQQLDYQPCANEGGTCTFAGPKYMAYGINDKFVYKAITGFGSNTVACNTSTFGDPAPHFGKQCWIANYGQVATEGNAPPSAQGEIAYGANGKFVFKTWDGFYNCNNAFFGSDPAPGVNKACYQALPEYKRFAGEGEMKFYRNNPAAYGANGHYYFKVLDGWQACSPSTFGGDPAYGVVKSCYVLDALPFGTENVTMAASGLRHLWYGSGRNGLYAYRSNEGPFLCAWSTFGFDPDWWVDKGCYIR